MYNWFHEHINKHYASWSPPPPVVAFAICTSLPLSPNGEGRTLLLAKVPWSAILETNVPGVPSCIATWSGWESISFTLILHVWDLFTPGLTFKGRKETCTRMPWAQDLGTREVSSEKSLRNYAQITEFRSDAPKSGAKATEANGRRRNISSQLINKTALFT